MFNFLRKDLLLVAAVAAVVVSLSYAIGYVTKRPVTTVEAQPAFLDGERAPKGQSASGRIWKEPSFEKLVAVGAPGVAEPAIMRVANSGEIYILDWADLRIKRFSPDGRLLSVFGDGKGTGPGGFTNPTSFTIAPNGELWVSDPVQRKLTHFQPDGTAQAIASEKGLYRVAVLGDVLVTMVPPSNTALFDVYSLSGKQLESFGEFIQNQGEQGIILDGNIVSDADGNGGFVYGGRHLGVIAAYGVDGSQRFIAQTIDRNALPKVLHTEGRTKVKSHGTDTVLSLSILGDYVYVLSGTRADVPQGGDGQVMDVYDKRNGNYVSSLRLPVTCSEAIVRGDLVYTLGDEGVTVWRLRQSS